MAINDLFKVVAGISVHGVECQNSFWYRQREDDGDPDNDIDGLMAAIEFAWFGSLDAFLSTDAVFGLLQVWNYTNGVDYVETEVAGAGTITDPALPTMFAVGMKMGRPGVGWNYPRKRVSGFAQSAFVDNEVETGLAANLGSMCNGMRSLNAAGDVFQWVIIRPHSSFALGNVVLLNEGNVGTFLSAYDATQRSRNT